MSGSIPTTPVPESVRVKSRTLSYIDIAQSGRYNSRKSNFHLWELTVSYPPMDKDEFRPLWAFINSQYGSYDTFTITPIDTATPRGAATGSPTITSTTASTLTIGGATASITNWLKKGDLVKISGDPKTYMCTDDVNTDGSGNATFNIFPDLIATPSASTAVIVNNVSFSVFCDNIQEYRTELGGFYRYELDLIEAI